MTTNLIDLSTAELLDKFGAGSHKPGSGSAAALQGLLSAQLLQTVISLTDDPRRAKHYAAQLPRLRRISSAVESRIIPSLKQSFQQDSDCFARVIQLRQQKAGETDSVIRKQLADQATLALMPATEIPIQIAKDCVELARFAMDVFDNGFQSALGDSGVALNAAISAISGSLSIVELNLTYFEASDWTASIRASRDTLVAEFDELTEAARKRLASQVSQTERKTLFSRELQAIATVAKGKRHLPESEIEATAVRLQRALWINKDLVWRKDTPESPFDVLDPDKTLECFDLMVHHATTLGQHFNQGTMFEVAGQIDQPAKVVSISDQFPHETRNFTAAHELGHHLLHTQSVLHRDRPLTGVRVQEPRDSEEWQADKFASYFLMPTKLLKRAFVRRFLTEQFSITEETAFALNERSTRALRDKCGDLRGLARLLAKTTSFNGVHFKSLAEQFRVSAEAMAIRLEELKLLDFESKTGARRRGAANG